MAIHLFCYVSLSVKGVTDVIGLLSEKHKDLFSYKFLISEAGEPSEVGKEIALEFGLSAKTLFLIRLNDKSAAERLEEVANIVRDAFGNGNALVLFDGEKPI
jgi:hypothetical protein